MGDVGMPYTPDGIYDQISLDTIIHDSAPGDDVVIASCPDVHNGMSFLFQNLQNRHYDALMISGDVVEGRWWMQEYIDKWGEDPAIRVPAEADVQYGNFLDEFQYYQVADKLLMCPGDHEYGDDSMWEFGTTYSAEFPYFRSSYATTFNLDDSGNTLYGGTIAGVPQRPVGTDYDNTSYAVIESNVLIVSLDLHYFVGPDVELGEYGTVSPELTPDQKIWFDDILQAGNSLDSVDFIVVQSHYPVLPPATCQLRL
jgi:hypothetical protein